MTRKQNKCFVKVGFVALAGMGLVAIVGPLALHFGLASSEDRAVLNGLFSFLGLFSFISLVWFGVMPRAGTMMYLRGYFDSPQRAYMHTWPFYRFVFLITDDPRVLSRNKDRI